MRPASSPTRKPCSVKNLNKHGHQQTTKPRMISVRSKGQTPQKPIPNPTPRRKMSTHLESPEQTFMEEFCRQVNKKKKEIHVLRQDNLMENLKENSKEQQHVLNYDKAFEKVKGSDMQFGATFYEKEDKALERLISRNHQALKSFVQNRKQLLELYIAKQLKPTA